LNAFFGLFQKQKQKNQSTLKKITVTKIRVVRNGKEQEIESKYLVPGDICFIEKE
jgi:Ca2+-transporting ATPase